MNRTDRTEMLQDAREDMLNAIVKIENALRGTNEFAYAEAYMIGHLINWADDVNSFDKTLPKYIDDMGNGETEIYD